MLPVIEPTYMLREHIPECMEIDAGTRCEPWEYEDYLSALAELQWSCRIVEFDDEIWGYVMYSMDHDSIVIERLQVRRCYLGTGLQESLLSFLRMRLNRNRSSLVRILGEYDLNSQVWFRSQGFRAEGIAQKYYSEPSESVSYLMRYHRGNPVADVLLNKEDTLVGV